MPFPLVGRSQELADLTEQLSETACQGVMLIGPAGIGKSSLVRAVCDALHVRGRRTLQLPTPKAGALPAAVLLGVLDPTSSAPLLDQALATLARQRTVAGAPVLVCEDVDALDTASEELLRSAALGGSCKLLATRRADRGVVEREGPLGALLEPMVLSGLDVLSTRTLASAVAGARVGGVTGARLHAHTSGNPFHIVEVVRHSLESGALHPDPDGTLRARADLPLTQDLAATIDARLLRLDRSERRAVELVALGQPLQAEHLRHATVDQGIVESLKSAGLVTHGPDGLSLGHPLHTEAVLARLPPERRRRHLTRLLAAVAADPQQDRTLRVQLAVWQAELGGTIPDHTRVHAARAAMAVGQHEEARQLVERSTSLDAELVRAELEAVGNRPAAALQRLEWLQPSSMTERAHIALVGSRIQLLTLGDAEEAARTLEAVPIDGLPSGLRDELTAARALLLLLAGRPGEAAQLATEVDPTASPRAAVELWVATSIAEMLAGDMVAAVRQAGDGLAGLAGLTGPDPLPFAEVQLGCTVAYADLYAGRVDAALERCREHQARHLPSGGAVAGLWSSMRGHAELLAGNLLVARDVASDAVAVTRAQDPLGHGGLTLADNALASAMLGDLATTRQLLAELEHRPDASSPRIAVNLSRVRAWTAALEGDMSAAIGHALSGATDAAAVGYHSWALMAAHDAVRWGAAPAALPILERSARGLRDARFLELLVEHARAVVDDDDARLATVAEGFLAAGARLHAAEVLQQAKSLAVRHGGPRRATALERRIAAMGIGGAWLLRDLPPSAPLTRREQQVAQQAAAGRSNRAIATSLGVSPRTVENHLASVYSKLGITGRHELTRQLIEATVVPRPGRIVR